MIRSPKAVAYPIIAAALALVLALSHTSPAPAQAQAINPSYVSIHTSQASVPEGGLAAFVLLRSGGDLDRSVTVQVRSWEPNHVDAFGVNDTEQFHDVTFARADIVATLNVVAVQDQRYDPPQVPPLILNAHTLNAEIVESADDSYHLGDPVVASLDIVDVNAPPFPQSQIYIQSSDTPLAVTEGNDAVLSLNRTGDTTQPLAVDILVDDPDGHLRGQPLGTAASAPCPDRVPCEPERPHAEADRSRRPARQAGRQLQGHCPAILRLPDLAHAPGPGRHALPHGRGDRQRHGPGAGAELRQERRQ